MFNLDFVPWQSLNCAYRITYIQKVYFAGAIPMVFVVLIAVCGLVLWVHGARNNASGPHQSAKRSALLWKLSTFTAFLIYPNVSAIVLGLFNCIEINGIRYMVQDFLISCDSTIYRENVPIGVALLLLYPVGIPLLYIVLLKRSELRNPLTLVKLGDLYDAYSYNCWYFEVVDLAFKLVLTSIVPLVPLTAELRAGMVGLILYLIAVLVIEPYIQKGTDRLRQLTLLELYLFMLLGYTISAEGFVTDSQPVWIAYLLTCLLVAMPIGLLIGTIVMVTRNCTKLRLMMPKIAKPGTRRSLDSASSGRLRDSESGDYFPRVASSE